MLDVCLLGTSGMMPLPGRWLTSLMTRFGGSSILIDCGEGTQIAIREKGWSVHPIDVICFTHYHGDHISGLPGLLLSMGNSDRTEPVTLVGPPGLEKTVNALRIIAPGLPFPLKFIELNQKVEKIEINGYHITAFRVSHNVPCYGYTMEIPRGGKFFPEKAAENEVPMKYWSRLQKGEVIQDEDKCYTPDMVIGPARKGIKLTYCTDTRPIDAIAEYAKDADLFICEGMYGDKEKLSNAKEHRHMMIYEAAELATKACVHELWLTHYSPSMIYPDDYIKDARKIFKNMYSGKDGKSVDLQFEEENEI